MDTDAQLLNLLQTNTVHRFLFRRARNAYVSSLRKLLHDLGFGQDLNWDRLGDNPFYGEETVIAVRHFGRRNDEATDGATVSPALVWQMLQLKEARSGLQLIRRAIDRNQMEAAFVPTDPNNFGTQQLVPVLRALQIPFETVPEGLSTFAQTQGLSNFSGTRMTDMLGRALIAELKDRYGPGRTIDPELPDPGGQPTPPIDTKPVTRLDVIHSQDTVTVSDGSTQVVFRKRDQGVMTPGFHRVTNFVNENRQQLLASNIIPQGIEVVEAVSQNEGRLDGINTYDRGVVSVGVYQWTLGSMDGEGELPALLKKVKSTFPRTFRTYFQAYGLDVSEDTNTTYGYLTYEGEKIFSQSQKDRFRVPEWAFRFWRATQEAEVQTIQVKHALARLKNFYWHPHYAAYGYTLNELITSSFGVALLLDNHVNRPAWVGKCVAQAMQRTGLTSGPENWSTQEERRLIDEYLRVRVNYSENGYSPMTNASGRAQKIALALRSGDLSDHRLSFRVRESQIRSYNMPFDEDFSARSVAPVTNGVAPPEDFSQKDYPIINMDIPQ